MSGQEVKEVNEQVNEQVNKGAMERVPMVQVPEEQKPEQKVKSEVQLLADTVTHDGVDYANLVKTIFNKVEENRKAKRVELQQQELRDAQEKAAKEVQFLNMLLLIVAQDMVSSAEQQDKETDAMQTLLLDDVPVDRTYKLAMTNVEKLASIVGLAQPVDTQCIIDFFATKGFDARAGKTNKTLIFEIRP